MRYDIIPILNANGDVTATLAATTSSAALALGRASIWLLTADLPFNLKRGTSAVGAASTADFRVPANFVLILDTANAYTNIRIYNPDGANSLNYWLTPCSAS